jgi:predicted amidohydrolase
MKMRGILRITTGLLFFCCLSAFAQPAPGTVRIAMCQIFCLDGDRSGNLVRIEEALREAREQKAQIACFPETSLYGWVNPTAHQRAQPIPGRDSDALCRLAKKYGMFLCVGLAEKENENLYDTALLIDDSGRILLKHRKMNILRELMSPPYTPGTEIQSVDTSVGRIGILICADTFWRKNLDGMALLKPDLVLVPYGWAAKEESWPAHGKELHATVAQAASVMRVPVVGTDLVGEISHGPWRGYVYGGQSVAANAQGRILVTAKDRDRDIVVFDIQYKQKRVQD